VEEFRFGSTGSCGQFFQPFGSLAEPEVRNALPPEIRTTTSARRVIWLGQVRPKISQKNVCIEGHRGLKTIPAQENQNSLSGLKGLREHGEQK
jgi:hypothetical protein